MNDNTIEKKLIDIFHNIFETTVSFELENIYNLSMDNFPDWDSLFQLNILSIIEQEFSLKIPDDISFKLTSFSAINSYLKNQLISSRDNF